MPLSKFAAVLTALLCAATAARADEGMWTFDNFPSAAVKAKYGVTIDNKWLDHVRDASVRLSTGCSASVVTASGLVLTNHHCVRDCAQNLSSATTNYVHDGFSAAKREDEQLCAGMQAEILDGISDVTPAINTAVAGKSGGDYVKARDAAIAATEKTGCAGREAQFRCQVITLYQGGQYKLYRYRKYADVRLAFAPEEQTAFFGGDPDNFNFPRYDLDFSFVRLYENGKPAVTPDHLTWSAEAPKDGAPIFISGNPGSTQRLLTADQLKFLRDLQLPETLILYSELRGRLIRFAGESPEHARTSEGLLFGIENSFKAYHGQQQALIDPALIAAKTQYDHDLQAAVKKDAALSASIGDPWADIAAVQTTRRALYRPYYFMEARAGQGSDLFRYARALVRAADERAKPNGERLPEYTDSKLALLQKTLLDAEPVYPDVEQLTLEFWLSKLRENLTADSEGAKVFLGKDSPETLSAVLSKSALGDPALRKKLWDGGKASIETSTDPMIVFARRVDAASRAVRKQYEDKVLGPTDRAAEKIAKARFAIHGTSDYPDATFSLRLSYGAVQGWEENGKPVAPFTRFAGLWQRATGQFPFNLAPKWQQAEGKVNPDTVFDFISNNDIIGGNSGSPAITAKGEVVGAAFDGNIHSLGGSFGFDPKTNRTVMVSTAAVTEALKAIYGNERLVTELTSR
jgi:V8-like Glu-specific endopeptidase